jgi:prepilin-type N-terminal cleavage/methylation domain-containing protein
MRKKSAFTLIELLVVIAIIALLMAILLPVLSRVRKQARAMVCQSHLRQWGTVLAAYTEANEGRLPATPLGPDGIWLLRGAFISDKNKDANAPQNSLHHFHTKDIVCCPVATQPSGMGGGGFSAGGGSAFGGSYQIKGTPGATFEAWEITTPAPAFRGSYGFNQWLFEGFSERPRISLGQLVELDVLSFWGRADIPVLLDAAMPWSEPRDMLRPPLNPDRGGGLGILNFCLDRHNGCVNGLFLDWSVRRVGLKELWTLKWYDQFDRAGRWTKAGGVKPAQWPKWMRNFKDY